MKFLIEFRCDFDGGDCDGIEEPLETKLPNCPGEAWVGNGKCDDEVNIPECNYDGGIFFFLKEYKNLKIYSGPR